MVTGVGVYCIKSCIDNIISQGNDVVRIDNLTTELYEERRRQLF